ncbi:hypothetical protein [Caenispirillum bisanense]|uniref:hypothetical protein n=1 Tax=Caenispirillum bisanense TaxID=414052 RepID=UPI0031D2D979
MGGNKRMHPNPRMVATLDAARDAGLLDGEKDTPVTARLSRALVEAARDHTHATTDEELLEYALAKVVVEDDDFGDFLISQRGTVDPAVDLEI